MRACGAQLGAMSDNELRDLGVGRSELRRLMRSQAARHPLDRWGNRHRAEIQKIRAQSRCTTQ